VSATTLLHEAYLDIAARVGPSFPDRARFMGYAARVMRGLLIDHARNRRVQKRGGQFEITSLVTDGKFLPDEERNSSLVLPFPQDRNLRERASRYGSFFGRLR
jgi:DNA-directed RNA polymerase specialized sigma24 family protein